MIDVSTKKSVKKGLKCNKGGKVKAPMDSLPDDGNVHVTCPSLNYDTIPELTRALRGPKTLQQYSIITISNLDKLSSYFRQEVLLELMNAMKYNHNEKPLKLVTNKRLNDSVYLFNFLFCMTQKKTLLSKYNHITFNEKLDNGQRESTNKNSLFYKKLLIDISYYSKYLKQYSKMVHQPQHSHSSFSRHRHKNGFRIATKAFATKRQMSVFKMRVNFGELSDIIYNKIDNFYNNFLIYGRKLKLVKKFAKNFYHSLLRISLKYFFLFSFHEQRLTPGAGISLILESDRGYHRPQEGFQGDVIHQRHGLWQTVERLRQCGSDVPNEGCTGALASTLSTIENHNYTVVAVVTSVVSVTRPSRVGAIEGACKSSWTNWLESADDGHPGVYEQDGPQPDVRE